jgi:hypothetical protein
MKVKKGKKPLKCSIPTCDRLREVGDVCKACYQWCRYWDRAEPAQWHSYMDKLAIRTERVSQLGQRVRPVRRRRRAA